MITLLNAHASTARTARRKLLTDRFEELLTEWGSPYSDARSLDLLAAVDDAGFTLPEALDDAPPLTGPVVPDDSPGRRAFRSSLCDRFGHQLDALGECRRCGTAFP